MQKLTSSLVRVAVPLTRHTHHHASSPRPSRYALILGTTFTAVTAAYFLWPDTSRSAPTSKTSLLSPSHFTPATVLSNDISGPDTKLMELEVPKQLLPTSLPGLSPIWSVYIKDDDIQVERPYTPLEGIDENGRMRFWIKRYPKGEVGRWLHSKKSGDQVELRAPLTTWLWTEGDWDEVLMISGGTGITPFYQLFHSIISQPTLGSTTHFTLLHSSRNPKELPPPSITGPLVEYASLHPERLSVRMYVDNLDAEASEGLKPNEGRITKEAVQRSLNIFQEPRSWWATLFGKSPSATPPAKKVLVLVCGPDPMLAAIAGPFGRNMSQGSVSGVLGELGFNSSNVRKL